MKHTLILSILLSCFFMHSQNWMLKLSSTVELRSWRLTNTAEKSEKALSGASIKLYKGDVLIGETSSDANGDFVIDIPSGGEFVLTIYYSACNTKKFNVSTTSVDENVGKDYKPSISISGFIMSKPLKGVDYIGLNEPLVKVEYKSKGQNFNKDETVTNKGLNILSKIYDSETALIQKFCAVNKAGDDAMKNHNCLMAIDYYLKAINMLPGEQYPVDQMTKAELCVKNNKAEAEALAESIKEKANAAKIANEKTIAEKQAKDKEQFNKTTNDKLAKEKMLTDKESKNKTNKENPPKEKIIPNESEPVTNESNIKKGNSNHSLPNQIGKNVHKETITKADGFFKMKRYKEAKTEYEKALTLKTTDTYSKNKLVEIEKLLSLK